MVGGGYFCDQVKGRGFSLFLGFFVHSVGWFTLLQTLTTQHASCLREDSGHHSRSPSCELTSFGRGVRRPWPCAWRPRVPCGVPCGGGGCYPLLDWPGGAGLGFGSPGNSCTATRPAASGGEPCPLCPLGGCPPGRGVRRQWCPVGGRRTPEAETDLPPQTQGPAFAQDTVRRSTVEVIARPQLEVN